jgi:hypothetical protein
VALAHLVIACVTCAIVVLSSIMFIARREAFPIKVRAPASCGRSAGKRRVAQGRGVTHALVTGLLAWLYSLELNLNYVLQFNCLTICALLPLPPPQAAASSAIRLTRACWLSDACAVGFITLIAIAIFMRVWILLFRFELCIAQARNRQLRRAPPS